jgi:hypothetical protein
MCWSAVPSFPLSWIKTDVGQLEMAQAGLCFAMALYREGACSLALLSPVDTVLAQ